MFILISYIYSILDFLGFVYMFRFRSDSYNIVLWKSFFLQIKWDL